MEKNMKKTKHEYVSQPLKQNWDQELPKYWFDGSPLKTHFMNSISILVPISEYSAIHTLKESQKVIKDPELKAQVAEMIAQENWHSYSHRKYNEWLDRQGYPALWLSSKYMASQLRIKKLVDKTVGEKAWLPGMVAGEHNAVCIMEYFLERPAMLATMHPHFRQAWVWHFLEELEHKGTSMDIWNDTKEYYNRKHILLKLGHIVQGTRFNLTVLRNMCVLLAHDKQLWKWKTLKDASFLFGFDGLFFKTIGPWMRLFLPNWHPWNQVNTIHLINQYSKLLDLEKLTPEMQSRIDNEFQGCISDIDAVIKENNSTESSNIKVF